MLVYQDVVISAQVGAVIFFKLTVKTVMVLIYGKQVHVHIIQLKSGYTINILT